MKIEKRHRAGFYNASKIQKGMRRTGIYRIGRIRGNKGRRRVKIYVFNMKTIFTFAI